MTTSYEVPVNMRYYVITQLGVLAANGRLVTTSTLTGNPQQTFRLPGGFSPNPTDMRLGEDGSPGFAIYCGVGDGFDPYTFTTYDSDGNLIYREPFVPANGGAGGGDITVFTNVVNYNTNPQFIFWSSATDFPNSALPNGDTEVADSWIYTRGNQNATIDISRQLFDAGSTDVPFSPPTYLQYSCTSPGIDTDGNYIGNRWGTVQMLNNQIATASIWAATLLAELESTLTLLCIQNFGSGGSSPVITEVHTFTLNNTWNLYQHTFTPLSIGGKTIGTGDYLEFAWQFQSNQFVKVGICDAYSQDGTGTGMDFPYISPTEQYAEIFPGIVENTGTGQGTNVIGWLTPSTEEVNYDVFTPNTLHRYLVQSTIDTQRQNALIGWNFIVNPNQFGSLVNSTTVPLNNNGTYIADQTILLSDGNNIAKKTNTIGQPLVLEVVTISKKFGIGQIIENLNSQLLIGQTVSFALRIATSATSTTMYAALITWNGTVNLPTKAMVATWNGTGVNPTLAAGLAYLGTPFSFTVTDDEEVYYLQNLIDIPSSAVNNFCVMVWTDSDNLIATDTIRFYEVELSIGEAASRCAQLDVATTLKQCQRYVFRTDPLGSPLFYGNLSQTNAYAGTAYFALLDSSTQFVFEGYPIIVGYPTYLSNYILGNANYVVFPVPMVFAPTSTFLNNSYTPTAPAVVPGYGHLIPYASGAYTLNPPTGIDVTVAVLSATSNGILIAVPSSGANTYEIRSAGGIGTSITVYSPPSIYFNITAIATLGA